MFSTLNEKYQKTISDTEDEKLIMEAITGSDMDPSIEAAAEDEVDVYSVPRKDLDRLDKFADKLVSSSDYDDEDLDDLLDDGYEDAIVVAEASVTTPSGDKPGDYNSGIKSGKVDYDMNDCEDRGGVGVNSVIARNDQLSEAILMINNFQMCDMLCEAAAESPSKTKAILGRVASAMRAALRWCVEKIRTMLSKLVGPFKKMWAAIQKAYKARKNKKTDATKGEQIDAARKAAEEWQAKQEEARKAHVAAMEEARKKDEFTTVTFVPGIYEDSNLIRKAESAANAVSQYADGKLRSFRNRNVSAQPMDTDIDKIIKVIEDVKYNAESKKINFEEAYNIMAKIEASFGSGLKETCQKMKAASSKFETMIKLLDNYGHIAKFSAANTMSDMDNVDPDDLKSQEAIVQKASAKSSKAADYGRQSRAANRAISALSACVKRTLAIVGIHEKNLSALYAAIERRNSKEGIEYLNSKKGATVEAVTGTVYSRAYKFVNESCIGRFYDYFDEATDTLFFDYELEEASANSSTYEEFKEHLKTDGTLKVEPPKVDAHPKDDMAKRDPAQPGLTNETSLAKNTLCKAYTADQLASIPSSKMSAVRTAIANTIATKNAAIASLKESYDAHLGDSYEVRSAILEDASMIRRDLDNLQHNLALVEDMLNPESLDSLAESVFDGTSNDWSYLFEDSEADLDDLDMSDDEDKDDDDDKKSKKSEDKSDKEDKDDDKKEDKDDEEVDESASLLAVIGDLMSALD